MSWCPLTQRTPTHRSKAATCTGSAPVLTTFVLIDLRKRCFMTSRFLQYIGLRAECLTRLILDIFNAMSLSIAVRLKQRDLDTPSHPSSFLLGFQHSYRNFPFCFLKFEKHVLKYFRKSTNPIRVEVSVTIAAI